MAPTYVFRGLLVFFRNYQNHRDAVDRVEHVLIEGRDEEAAVAHIDRMHGDHEGNPWVLGVDVARDLLSRLGPALAAEPRLERVEEPRG